MRILDRVGRVLVVAIILGFVLGTAALAGAATCAAAGSFEFASAGGSGTLVLSTDGSASMHLVPAIFCPSCDFVVRVLTGTYRTAELDDGRCTFTLELSEAGGHNTTIIGVVAFQGLALLFQRSTVPNLGVGLALRVDTLR